MKRNNYIALLEHDKDTGKYGVIVPDIPGFSTVGNDYEDAIQNAVEGLASHIEVMHELGEKIPAPRTFEQIKAKWSGWADWVKDAPDYFTAIIPAIPCSKYDRMAQSIYRCIPCIRTILAHQQRRK